MRITTEKMGRLMIVAVLLGFCSWTQAGLGDLGKAVKVGKKLVEEDKKKKEEGDSKHQTGDAAPAGKAEAGNIVFSKSPIHPDQPENLTNSFQAGDSIYAVVYPKNTFKDMSDGSSSMFVEIKCDLDGKHNSRAGFNIKMKNDALDKKVLVLDVSPAPDKMTSYGDPNLIYQKQFEKMGKKGGPMQLTQFLSRLTPGKHTIQLTLYHYADMAVGRFTIEGQDFKTPYEKRFQELDASNTAGVSMPEPKMNDSKLESEMYRALKNSQVKEAKDGEVLQIVVIDPDWHLERHKISGAVLGRHIRAVAAMKEKDGPCWMWQFTFRQDFIGNAFQKVKLDGIYERQKITEANVRKETFE